MNVQTVFAGGINPWAIYFRPERKKYPDPVRIDLEIRNDKIEGYQGKGRMIDFNQQFGNKSSKYAHNFDKMKVGQCVVVDALQAKTVSMSMERWIIVNRKYGLSVYMVRDYKKSGKGRVWMVKA